MMRRILALAALTLVVTSCPSPIMRDVLRFAEDGFKPVITVQTPQNRGPLTSLVTFTGTVIDSASAENDGEGRVDSLTYTVVDHESLDGSAVVDPDTGVFSFTIDTSELRGDQTVTLVATDWNGNRSTLDIVLVDTGEGPDISITTPAQNSVYLSSVTVTGLVNDAGDATTVTDVDTLHYEVLGSSIDGNVIFNGTTGAFTFTFSTVGLTSNTIVVRLTATDKNGRDNSADLELLDVGIGPAVDVTTPAPYSSYQNSVTFDGSVTNRTDPSSASEVESLTYQVLNYPTVTGSVAFDADTGAFSFAFSTLTPVVMTAATLVIRLTARDLNDRATTLDYNLVEDPAGPYIDVDNPADGSAYGLLIDLDGTVSNSQTDTAVTDVATLTYQVNSGAVTNLGVQPPTGPFSIQLSTLGVSGTILLRIRAADRHGHVTEETLSLIDNLPGPSLTNLSAPTAYSSVSTTGITIDGTVGNPANLLNGEIEYSFAYSGGPYEGAIQVGDEIDLGTGDFSFTVPRTTPNPDLSGNLTISLTAKDQASRESTEDLFITDDPVSPAVIQGTVALDNTYVDINLSEPAYTAAGSGALVAGDLKVNFFRNGGTATAAAITGVARTDGSALQGGELAVRVYLNITGSPSGVETVAILPFNGSSIYDYVGNPMSSSSSTGALDLVDEAAPAPPGAPDLAVADDTGASTTDNVTKNTTALTFSGFGVEPYSTLTLYTDNPVLYAIDDTPVTSGGTWSLDVALPEGVHSITATARDGGGHESAPSTPLTVTVDTTAPTAPGTPDLDAFDDSGLDTSDNVTRNTTGLTFAVTASEAGTLELFRGGTTSLATATATGAGTFAVDNVSLAAGSSYSITAKLTDAAGNTSAASTALNPVVVDNTAPAAPAAPDLDPSDDSGSSTTDNVTSTTTGLTFNGTSGAVADGRIYLYRAGSTLIGFVDTPSAGTWTVDGVSAVVEGSNSITATALDLAGNESTASSALSLTIDTTAPTAPATPDLKTASDTGSSTSDNITSDNTPTFSVTVPAAGTIKLYEGGSSEVATLAVVASGAHDVTASTLTDGLNQISATFTDSAGSESAQSTALDVTVDTASPATPGTPDLLAATDNGVSTTDNITNDTTPSFDVTVSDAGTITLYRLGTTSIATLASTGAGAYTLTAGTLSAGNHSITAAITDVAGNTSSSSAALTPVTIDTSAPAAPGGTPNLVAADDSGSSNNDDTTNITSGLTFTGASGGGTDIRINLYRASSVLIGYVDTTAASWTVDGVSDVIEGSNTITSKAMDLAGNESAASTALTLTIDITAPAVPTVVDLKTASDSGDSTSDNLTNDTTPTVTVTVGTGNSTVRLYHSDTTLMGTVATTGSGGYDVTSSALTDGVYQVTATRTDAAGNESDENSSPVLEITVDTDGEEPALPDLDEGSDTGASATDQITFDTTPGFSIAVTEGGTIRLYRSGTVQIASATATTSGTYSLTSSTLTATTHSITAKLTDKAGNESAASSALSVTVDTSAPSAPGTPNMTAATDTGSDDTDELTSDTTPDFTVTAGEAGTLRLYRAGSTEIASGASTGSGTYTLTPGALADGSHSITAKLEDVAGNASSASSALPITIDGAVSAPGTPDLKTASDSGLLDDDDITQDTTPTVDITVTEAGTIELFSDEPASLGTVAATGAGTFSITSSALAEGTPTLTAVLTDTAGNVSSASSGLTITVDTTDPSAPTSLNLATADDTGTNTTDNITATQVDLTIDGLGAEADGRVSLSSSLDGALGSVDTSTAGAWTLDVDLPTVGTHTISAVVTDAAGNDSAAGTMIIETNASPP